MEDNLQKFLDELRSRIAVSDIVSEKVKLTKRGREYMGLCPFHNEKTPSFTVNDAKGFYAANAHRSLEKAVNELDTRENGKKYYITYHEHLAEGVKIAKNADAIKNIAVLYDELSEKYGG